MTSLCMRPARVRMFVAYMADAALEFDHSVTPQSTLDRMGHKSCHPYTAVWQKISLFYERMDMQAMCDSEITDMWNAASRVGFKYKYGNKQVAANKVQQAIKAWRDCGWYRYEQQRDGRRKTAAKLAYPAIAIGGLMFGVFIPPA